MPSPRRSETDAEATVVPLHKPKFVVAEGRGGSGKSTAIRVLVERAQAAHRPVTLVDLDPRAQLRDFFEGVSAPSHTEEIVVHEFLDAVVNAQAALDPPPTLLLDMNGNDPAFGRFAKSLELVDMLAAGGILPVRIRLLGTDPEDADDMARDDASGAFVPDQTVLVLNEGVIRDGRPRDLAFADVRAHRAYQAALERGAREVFLPRLACMRVVSDRRLQFGAAETDAALGMTNRQRVAMWRRAVEEALAPVQAWLP